MTGSAYSADVKARCPSAGVCPTERCSVKISASDWQKCLAATAINEKLRAGTGVSAGFFWCAFYLSPKRASPRSCNVNCRIWRGGRRAYCDELQQLRITVHAAPTGKRHLPRKADGQFRPNAAGADYFAMREYRDRARKRCSHAHGEGWALERRYTVEVV